MISLLVLILLRFVAGLVIWFSLLGLSAASALGTVYVWMKWKQNQETLNIMSSVNANKFEQQRITENWFTFALTATVLWFVFVLIILVMRKRIQLVSEPNEIILHYSILLSMNPHRQLHCSEKQEEVLHQCPLFSCNHSG